MHGSTTQDVKCFMQNVCYLPAVAIVYIAGELLVTHILHCTILYKRVSSTVNKCFHERLICAVCVTGFGCPVLGTTRTQNRTTKAEKSMVS